MGVTAIRQVYSCTKGKTRYSGSSCGGVLAEYYNKSFRRTSKKKIPMELSKYGGFYAGKDAYFLVFGQDNPQDNDNVEVLRVVKYSKNGSAWAPPPSGGRHHRNFPCGKPAHGRI